MTPLKLTSFVVIWLCSFAYSSGIEYRAKCMADSTSGADFRFEFRLAPQTDTTITQLAFYSSTGTVNIESPVINTPAQCVDDSLDSKNLFTVGFAVDGDDNPIPCGIIKSGNTYSITIAVVGSTNTAVKFDCITAGLGANLNFPSNLTITDFETGQIANKVAFRGNREDLRFGVIHADGNRIASTEARLGEMLKLRAVFDKDFQRGPDNWGRVFHVTFLPHADAEMSLQVITPGLGTRVKVTGSLSGETFTSYHVVKRDEVTKIIIPETYKPTLDSNDKKWKTETVAVKVEVEAPGEVVAVRALSRKTSGSEAGSFTVMPDDVLGKKYNCYTGADKQKDGLVNVYAVEDTTVLTVDLNTFNRGGFKINGNNVNMETETVNLDENDVLTMQCDDECDVITLEADKPIGVTTGHEDEKLDNGNSGKGYFVSQLPPVSTYGKEFVLSDIFYYQIVLEDPTATVGYTRQSGAVMNVASGTLLDDVIGEELFVFTTPVLLIASTNSGNDPPFTMPYPSTYQWANRNYVFVNTGESYTFTIVAQTGEIAKIEFRDTNGATSIGFKTIGDISGFSATPVNANSGTAYESYTFNPTNPITAGPALIELKTGSNHKPFMVIVKTVVSGQDSVQYMAIGTRFATVNPCGMSVENFPGDMKDNDCNGLIDDQINNETNSGSDLAPHPVNPHIGIYVDTLLISNNALFPTDGTARTHTLMTDGCPTSKAGDLSIQQFVWNQGIGEQFTTYHVLETQPFRAFFLDTRTVYFRVTIGYCYGNLTGSRCDNSCQTSSGRKRRDAEEMSSLDTHVTITDAVDKHRPDIDETCEMNKLYYIPTVLLGLTIFVELVMNGVFLYLKASLERLD